MPSQMSPRKLVSRSTHQLMLRLLTELQISVGNISATEKEKAGWCCLGVLHALRFSVSFRSISQHGGGIAQVSKQADQDEGSQPSRSFQVQDEEGEEQS